MIERAHPKLESVQSQTQGLRRGNVEDVKEIVKSLLETLDIGIVAVSVGLTVDGYRVSNWAHGTENPSVEQVERLTTLKQVTDALLEFYDARTVMMYLRGTDEGYKSEYFGDVSPMKIIARATDHAQTRAEVMLDVRAFIG